MPCRLEALYVGVGEGCDPVDVKVAERRLNRGPLLFDHRPVKPSLENYSAQILKVGVIT